jgi:hypothetical protein
MVISVTHAHPLINVSPVQRLVDLPQPEVRLAPARAVRDRRLGVGHRLEQLPDLEVGRGARRVQRGVLHAPGTPVFWGVKPNPPCTVAPPPGQCARASAPRQRRARAIAAGGTRMGEPLLAASRCFSHLRLELERRGVRGDGVLVLRSHNGYLSSRGGRQHRWHSLVSCDHGDSTTSRFDSPAPRGRTRCRRA